MRKGRSWAQSLLSEVDFPGEILTGVPVVELKGNTEAVVIHHRGVIAYEENTIRIASSLGPVLLTGSGLRIFRMNRERVMVHGAIRRVEIGAEE